MVEMATEETTAAEAFKVMLERHYRHLPVVDDQGKVLGILSIRNILEARIDDLLDELESKSHYSLALSLCDDNTIRTSSSSAVSPDGKILVTLTHISAHGRAFPV